MTLHGAVIALVLILYAAKSIEELWEEWRKQ